MKRPSAKCVIHLQQNEKEKKKYWKFELIHEVFFSKVESFIVENWYCIFNSKYWPSFAITFAHLSGILRTPRPKNAGSFKEIQEFTHFFCIPHKK